jgi:tetratricopeptide (TPR) repeat protein
MLNSSELRKVLAQYLPDTHINLITELAQIIADTVNNENDLANIDRHLQNNAQFKGMLLELGGAALLLDNSVVRFGSNNQLGDITISDVAGGDIFKFQITLQPTNDGTSTESTRLLKAAATFKKIGDIERAISFLDAAINYFPNPQVFLDRGRLFAETSNFHEAFNNFSHAIKISENEQLEIESRLERLRVNSARVGNWDTWTEDVKWLKGRVEGAILGEVLYFEIRYINDSGNLLALRQHEYALKTIEEALELGFAHPDVYLIRSEIHCSYYNYGLALNDINYHLRSAHSSRAISLKGFILAKMNRFSELYDYCTLMSELYPSMDFISESKLTYSGLEEEVICRYLIEYKFRKQYPRQSAAKTVLRFAKWHGIVINKHPQLAPILQELLESPTKIDGAG